MQQPSQINIELTNNCNKSCSFCGRAKARADKSMTIGCMPMEMIDNIMNQYTGSIIQFNKDGEPLLHPQIKEVGERCSHLITNVVTNGILLMEKAKELKDNFTTVTVSVIEDDIEQFRTVKDFVHYIGDSSPRVFIKFLGDYDNPEYEKLGLKTLRRSIHNPEGDTGYIQSKPPVPELGICMDFLNKPSIDWEGFMHICNRYDPFHKGVIGNVKEDPLDFLWNSGLRNEWLEYHKQGKRDKIALCDQCSFWGFPTS